MSATVTKKQVLGTLQLIRYYQKAAAAGCERQEIPDVVAGRGFFMDSAAAARTLVTLVNVAVNRRGGEPDSRGRKDTYEWRSAAWRDCRAVREYRTQRIVRRGSGLETVEARRRFPDVQEAFTEGLGWGMAALAPRLQNGKSR